ncbi:hypothetical protein ACLX1H_000826 [Fusarium chlamydosporum]
MRAFHAPISVIEHLSQSQSGSPAVRRENAELPGGGFETISYLQHWQNINDAAKNWVAELSQAKIARRA